MVVERAQLKENPFMKPNGSNDDGIYKINVK